MKGGAREALSDLIFVNSKLLMFYVNIQYILYTASEVERRNYGIFVIIDTEPS